MEWSIFVKLFLILQNSPSHSVKLKCLFSKNNLELNLIVETADKKRQKAFAKQNTIELNEFD